MGLGSGRAGDVTARDDVDKGELEDMMTWSFVMTCSVVMTGDGW